MKSREVENGRRVKEDEDEREEAKEDERSAT